MTETWPAAGAWAGHAAAAGGGVLLVGWLALRFARGPDVRRAVALAAVRGAVLAAVLWALPGWLAVPLPGFLTKPEPEPVMESVRPPAATPVIEAAEVEWVPVPVSPAEPEPEVAAEPPAEPARPAAAWVLSAYAAGAAFTAGQLLLGFGVLARWRRGGRPASPRVQRLFDELAVGFRRVPRLLVTDRVPGPVCFGVRRPTVLLPTTLSETATDAELRWVLTHELDHVRRGDAAAGVWAAVAGLAFFYVPWFWMVKRELRLAQEYLADAAAAAAGGRPVDYAAFLVSLAQRPTRLPHGAAAVRPGGSDLFRRVEMLIERDTTTTKPTRLKLWAATAGVTAAAVGLSGLTWAQAPAAPVPVKGIELEVAPRAVEAQGGVIVIEAVEAPELDEIAKLRIAIAAATKAGDTKAMNEGIEKLVKLAEKKATAPNGNVVKGVAVLAAPAAPVPVKGIELEVAPRAVEAQGGVIVIEAAEAPELDEIAKLRIAIAAATKAGDTKAMNEGIEKLVKLAEKKATAPNGNVWKSMVVPAAPPAPPVPGGVKRVRMVMADDGGDVEKVIEGLKKSAEGMKDNPEGKAAIEKTIAELRKQMAEAAKNPKKAVPPAGVPGVVIETVPFPDAAVKAKLDAMKAQLKAIEGNDAAAAAMKQAIENLEKAAAGRGLFGDADMLMLLDGIEGRPQGVRRLGFSSAAGKETGGRLGIVPGPLPEALSEQLDLKPGQGVLVAGVTKGSAAEKAGLKVNDVLLSVGGKEVEPAGVVKVVAGMKAGEAELVVIRKGKKETLKATLPELKTAEAGGVSFRTMSVSVSDGEFDLKAETETASYKLLGTTANGVPTATKIVVGVPGEKKSAKEYESLEKVPAEHQPAVKKLLKSIGG